MLGPLPPLHRTLVVLIAIAVGIASGVWLVHLTAVPTILAAGIGWGVVAGLLLTYVLLHDFHHHGSPARLRRH